VLRQRRRCTGLRRQWRLHDAGITADQPGIAPLQLVQLTPIGAERNVTDRGHGSPGLHVVHHSPLLDGRRAEHLNVRAAADRQKRHQRRAPRAVDHRGDFSGFYRHDAPIP
jgi:hypothetical protein